MVCVNRNGQYTRVVLKKAAATMIFIDRAQLFSLYFTLKNALFTVRTDRVMTFHGCQKEGGEHYGTRS